MTDGARLRQILLNGLTNAVKYASATATGIAVSVVVNEGTITFTVADDGAGLPEGIDQAALFQDFNAISHLSGSAGVHKRRKVQSTGLGLPICNRCGTAMHMRLRSAFAYRRWCVCCCGYRICAACACRANERTKH